MSIVAAPDVPACCQAQLLDVCHPDNMCVYRALWFSAWTWTMS